MTKQHILEEFKRTAAANDGVPLGEQRFAKETGIKKHDWYGKYWVKWSDAVVEAGFLPNQMTQAYDTRQILERYISLIRELKRLPVSGDLRIKHRNDPKFPSHDVFRSHLGKKTQLVSKVKEYCLAHKGFEDVLSLCDAINTTSKAINEEKASIQFTEGFVYLGWMRNTRFYKIGCTNNLDRRRREMNVNAPEETDIIHSIRTDDPVGIEAYWHKRFKERRKNGEWFELTPSDIKAFRRRNFM